MIRRALLLCVVASPAVAQTAIDDRPGRWVSAPRTATAPGVTPGATAAEPSRPLMGESVIAPAQPAIDRVATDPALSAPESRAGPRPAGSIGEAPDIALEVFDVLEPAAPLTPITSASIVPPAPRQNPQPRPSTAAIAGLPASPVDPVAPIAALPAREPGTPPLALVRVDGPEALVTTAPVPVAAVTLPGSDPAAPQPAQPAPVSRPNADPAPHLSRPRPSAPGVVQHVAAPEAARAAVHSAVLVPSPSSAPVPITRVAFMAMPVPDRYPYSVMAPELLPQAPQSLERTETPNMPRPEALAGVLLPPELPGVERLGVPVPPAPPSREIAPEDPAAPIRLPVPDPAALARMIEDAEVCWGFARLSHDAQWARLSVDVALDETNMPAGSSIRLTGFAGALSSDAEEAYRAADAALTGCAAATTSAPVTRSVTLVFDRNGVHLRGSHP